MLKPPGGALIPDNGRDPSIPNPRMAPTPRPYDGPWPASFMAIYDPAKDIERDTNAILALSVDGVRVPDDRLTISGGASSLRAGTLAYDSRSDSMLPLDPRTFAITQLGEPRLEGP